MNERRRINGGAGRRFTGNGLAQFYFGRPLWERGALIGLLTFAVGIVLATAAHYGCQALGWTWLHETLIKNMIEGLVIGYVAYGLSWLREQRLVRRMKEIGYLNHHIRNALQAIELAAYQLQDARERAKVVDEEVKRVAETLNKVSRAADGPGDDLTLDAPKE